MKVDEPSFLRKSTILRCSHQDRRSHVKSIAGPTSQESSPAIAPVIAGDDSWA